MHLLLTALTLGLWGISWAALAIAQRRKPWRCSVCYSRYVPGADSAPPADPEFEMPRIVLPIAPRRNPGRDQGLRGRT